jgi:hypothetical protein
MKMRAKEIWLPAERLCTASILNAVGPPRLIIIIIVTCFEELDWPPSADERWRPVILDVHHSEEAVNYSISYRVVVLFCIPNPVSLDSWPLAVLMRA